MVPTSRLPDQRATLSHILKAGTLYFLLVFAAGFLLGPIRELWAVPRFGPRTAELMEMPIMLLAIIFSACWIMRRLAVPRRPLIRLSVGATALGLLLVAELGVVFWLRGLSLGARDYLVKPFIPEELVARVTSALGAKVSSS